MDRRFSREVRPFLNAYCLECHDRDTRKGDLDLSPFDSVGAVAKDLPHWDSVLDRLRNADMPPAKSKQQPSAESRRAAIAWIDALRAREAHRHAGDPGPVMPRRLSNAEYDYTLRDLTDVDLHPTRTFPVDPANQAGFDNSAESLAMSPALVKKYLQAAREVSEHLVLQLDGFTFAPHPVVADTDRDKWAVFRIVDFYRRQPTDYADYFEAAWRHEHRAELGHARSTLADAARETRVSLPYLERLWTVLHQPDDTVGPLARVRAQWRTLPSPAHGAGSTPGVREGCVSLRDFVQRIRQGIVPEVKTLHAPPIQDGSQTLVMWKNREMASNRRKFDPAALRVEGGSNAPSTIPPSAMARPTNNAAGTNRARATTRHIQAPTPEVVQRGGFALAPSVVTRESSATTRMAAARKHGNNPELEVPADPAERARYEAAFARFADVFPDAFYITERARVYLDAEKEQENAGRLLSAGFHNMTGYFRDDQPLYDLILDDSGRRELDRLWDEFDVVASVPQRTYASFLWAERTDSIFMRDQEFDAYRPEDLSILTPARLSNLGALYLAKAVQNHASETAQQAIRDHFALVTTNIARVEHLRAAAEPAQIEALERFAARAYRRPLSEPERQDLRAFYRESRTTNGLDHEEALRDCVARVLLSPNFLFRMDLVEAAGRSASATAANRTPDGPIPSRPLSDLALASRLSFFLWSSQPDDRLQALAKAGTLHQPKVLRAELRRLMQDPHARNFVTEFAGNWLDFRRFEQINSVDRDRFPAFNNDLRNAMFEEPLRFVLDVVQQDRPVTDLLYARDTFVNGPLAKHYGIEPIPAGTNTWVHVADARAAGRGGLLPMAAFLTANSPGLRTSPVKRGNWVVKRILGERIPPPPAVVPELPKDEKSLGTLTLREALEQHRQRSGCRECHARFDSFGLVFESFGPVGERRSLDLGGRPVDTRADFPGGTRGVGLEGLVRYIHEHRENDFIDNLCRKLLAYGLGRTLIISDEPLIQTMRTRLKSDHNRFSSLIETVVTSPQFLNHRDTELARNP